MNISRSPKFLFAPFFFSLSSFVYPHTASAAATFPNDMVGSWCGVESEYTRVDIKAGELDEGDGLCTPISIKSQKGEGIFKYAIKLKCDGGVEGKKSTLSEEVYGRFNIDGKPYLIREGTLYVKDLSVVYRRCKQ